jgi:Fe-S-cluster-containing dehydrogenase component
MARYGMAIDLNYCIGCYNCQVACKDEHVGNDFLPIAKAQPAFGQFWMSIKERERMFSSSHIKVEYLPTPCQHCGEPACMKAAKEGAVYKRDDGIVIVDPQKAKGQKHLVDACPYGSIYWNEDENIPQKCTFCAHLMDDGWEAPRCVQSCPVSCMYFGDLDDPESKISRFLAENSGGEPYHPGKGTQPGVKYIGMAKPHLAGTVLIGEECGKDVKVTLVGADGSKTETLTDCFGDFAFDGLTLDCYTVQFEAAGYEGVSQEVTMGSDEEYMGDVVLEKGS